MPVRLPTRAATALVMLLGGLGWVLLGWLRVRAVPAAWWWVRDDAVITLSHARNWVEFGSIGVSPGDRVEAFSAPLHLGVAAVALLFADLDAVRLSAFLTVAAVAWTGAAAAGLVLRILIRGGLRNRSAGISAVALAWCAGALVAASWTTAGWLASGMENPLFVALATTVAWLSLAPRITWPTVVALAVALTALGLVRVEFLALMPPVLLGAAWLVAGGTNSRRATGLVIAGPIAAWIAVTAGRWLYFGHLLPNTAAVQGKGLTLSGLAGLAAVWAGWCACAWLIHRRSADGGRIHVLFAALLTVPVGQFVLFGPARMDDYRVLSLAVAVLALWLATCAALLMVRAERRRPTTAGGDAAGALAVQLGTVVLATAVLAAAIATLDTPRKLGWYIETRPLLRAIDEFAGDQPDPQILPITANPDLGFVSYTKSSVVVDLGLLGEPVLTRLNAISPELRDYYLHEIAAPDIVQAHEAWSCAYASWLTSPEFTERYEESYQISKTGPDDACDGWVPYTVWRRDATDELRLSADLLRSDNPAETVSAALAECAARPGGSTRCEGVRRAVWRVNDPLRERGQFDAVVAAFAGAPLGELDRLLLERPPGWDVRATELVTAAAAAGY